MKHRHLLRLGAALTTALVVGSMVSAPAQAAAKYGKVSGTVHASGISTFPDGHGPDAYVIAIWPAKKAPVTWVDEPPKYQALTGHGKYTLKSIKPGTYIVGAIGFNRDDDYGWYKGAKLSSKAKRITVKAGHTVSNINISLHRTATLSATVQNSAGTGISGLTVAVYDADGQIAGFNNTNPTETGGAVHAAGLPAGSYRYKISGPGIPTQWADGIDRFSAAKSVSVAQGKTRSGIVLTVRANPAIASSAKPTITGTTKKGHTLTSSDAAWATTPTSFSYRWLRNGKPISGATSKTYTLVKADVGKHITVRVGALAPDTVTGTITSNKTSKIKK